MLWIFIDTFGDIIPFDDVMDNMNMIIQIILPLMEWNCRRPSLFSSSDIEAQLMSDTLYSCSFKSRSLWCLCQLKTRAFTQHIRIHLFLVNFLFIRRGVWYLIFASNYAASPPPSPNDRIERICIIFRGAQWRRTNTKQPSLDTSTNIISFGNPSIPTISWYNTSTNIICLVKIIHQSILAVLSFLNKIII